MKSTTRILGTIGMTLFAACATHAQSWTDNLYVHTDIGPAFLGNGPTLFRGESNSGGFFFAGREHFQADTGIRGDLSLGYNLTKSFAIEVESGAIWNPGPNPDDSFYQIPAMLNVMYHFQLNDSWRVYLGAGAGGVVSITHSLFHDPALSRPFSLDDSDWSVGYQAQAGIKYALTPHVELDLGYKFLGIDEYNYHFGRQGVFVENLRVNDLFTHSAQLSLTWKF